MTLTHTIEVDAAGRRLAVTPHFAVVAGRLTCVGIDLRSPVGEWVEITTPIVRAVRASEIIRAASDAVAASLPATVPGPAIPPQPTRRGRKRRLTDAVLRDVVTPAYQRTARQPVQAVRRALTDSGVYGGEATPDQARKAVVLARRGGFLPPA